MILVTITLWLSKEVKTYILCFIKLALLPALLQLGLFVFLKNYFLAEMVS